MPPVNANLTSHYIIDRFYLLPKLGEDNEIFNVFSLKIYIMFYLGEVIGYKNIPHTREHFVSINMRKMQHNLVQ